MSKHTPGPWTHHPEDNIITGGVDDRMIIEWQARSLMVSTAERDANARLIAAAPDLLAALGEMLSVMSYAGPDELAKRLGECYAKCAAIHKQATGEAS